MKILLGVTAGIAAYKAVSLLRLFIKEGHEVQVILSPEVEKFVGILTFSTLSKRPVYVDFVKNSQGEWAHHVELALWADVMILAPCTANTLSKMALGISDNLLLCTYFSCPRPIWVAPAMDLDMFVHPAINKNLETIRTFPQHTIIEPTEGELASGLIGKGRMAEPEDIFAEIQATFTTTSLKGKKIMLTAGPTQEAIDPVRFITNHSSGKMAYAIAMELQKRGAEVILISGPVQIAKPIGVNLLKVKTAKEMLEASLEHFPTCDAAIFAAAVADYGPAAIAEEKIKKIGDTMTLTLSKNPDIAAEIGKIKMSHQTTFGFALETEKAIEYGKEKLYKKNFDGIVINSLRDSGAGFQHDTNKITFISDRVHKDYPLKNKREVAIDIIDQLEECIRFKNHQ